MLYDVTELVTKCVIPVAQSSDYIMGEENINEVHCWYLIKKEAWAALPLTWNVEGILTYLFFADQMFVGFAHKFAEPQGLKNDIRSIAERIKASSDPA